MFSNMKHLSSPKLLYLLNNACNIFISPHFDTYISHLSSANHDSHDTHHKLWKSVWYIFQSKVIFDFVISCTIQSDVIHMEAVLFWAQTQTQQKDRLCSSPYERIREDDRSLNALLDINTDNESCFCYDGIYSTNTNWPF